MTAAAAMLRRPRRVAAAAMALAVVAVTGATLYALSDGGRPAHEAGAAGATTTIERRTLVARELVDGTLGYADTRTVVNRLGGSGSGADSGSDTGGYADGGHPGADSGGATATLTRTARPGSLVRRGGALYWVDGEPVLLMYGSTPAYRALKPGVDSGPDVQQLEENLLALGFYPGVVDEEYSSTTAAAVRDWQESLGLDETGQVELGRVVYLPGARRIGARKTGVGQALGDGAEVVETSSSRRVVKVELDVAKQSLARVGEAVRVTLPSGALVRGRITRVGSVAHAKAGSDGGSAAGGGTGEDALVIDVSIALRTTRGIGRFDQAPVSVALASERRKHALAVPVEALLARRGGGYAVELAGSRRLVPVRTGLFADGLVAVAGRGIRPGTRVTVPE